MRLNERSLENAALYYLERYATTKAGLRRVLTNKIKNAARRDERADAAARAAALLIAVDGLVDRYAAAGLVDDATFARNRAESLRRRGGSARGITAKLRHKGVEATTIAAVISTDDELAAACELCRRKRLGQDPDRRKRDLGVLARAGFSYSIGVQALDRDNSSRPRIFL